MSISSTDMVSYGFFDKDQHSETDSSSFENPSPSEAPHARAGQPCENKRFSVSNSSAFSFVYLSETDKKSKAINRKIADLESRMACTNPSNNDLVSFKKDLEAIVLSTGTDQNRKMALWRTRDIWNELIQSAKKEHPNNPKVRELSDSFSFTEFRKILRTLSSVMHEDSGGTTFGKLGIMELAYNANKDIKDLRPSFALTSEDSYIILEHGSFQKTDKALFKLDLSMFVDDDDLIYIKDLLK